MTNTQQAGVNTSADHLGYGTWQDVIKSPVTGVWLFLMVATTISWILGTNHGFDNPELASSVVLVIAFIKIRFVGMHFMEAGHSPAGLKWGFEALWVSLCAIVVIGYLIL